MASRTNNEVTTISTKPSIHCYSKQHLEIEKAETEKALDELKKLQMVMLSTNKQVQY